LESRIIELSVDDPEKLRREFGSMRTGLNGLTGEDTFCVDTSDCFSLESSTTFCDLWHFSDPGHRMLAEFLAENLLPVLAGRPGGH
jgi:hypothetical protein